MFEMTLIHVPVLGNNGVQPKQPKGKHVYRMRSERKKKKQGMSVKQDKVADNRKNVPKDDRHLKLPVRPTPIANQGSV